MVQSFLTLKSLNEVLNVHFSIQEFVSCFLKINRNKAIQNVKKSKELTVTNKAYYKARPAGLRGQPWILPVCTVFRHKNGKKERNN